MKTEDFTQFLQTLTVEVTLYVLVSKNNNLVFMTTSGDDVYYNIRNILSDSYVIPKDLDGGKLYVYDVSSKGVILSEVKTIQYFSEERSIIYEGLNYV